MRFISAILLVTVLGPSAFGAGPMCALLDTDKDPRVALLEAKLLADASATWVERTNIDKILKEQKLQALFSPQGVGERVRLGKLLKADVLVMVRPVKGVEAPTLEVVVSETASGLRLMLRAVPVTKSTDDDVAALLAAVREGIKRHGEKITEVVAVPPFVSKDLGYDFDHLKGAYAKLTEAVALDRRGAVVVELEEAQSLVKELALAAPGTKVERRTPLYIFGEYRHEGRGAERTVTLRMWAERGGKPVGKPFEQKLKPAEAVAALQRWAIECLAEGGPVAQANAKKEAAILAARARDFERLGYWSEALALIEASLLLDPDQPALRVSALRCLTPPIRRSWAKSTPSLEDARQARPLYLRGLAHLDALTADEKLQHYTALKPVGVIERFLAAPNSLISGPQTEAAIKEILTELREARRETLLPLIMRLVKRGGEEGRWVHMVTRGFPQKAQCELIERLLFELRELPQAEKRVAAYARSIRPFLFVDRTPPVKEPDATEYREFLQRLAASKDAEVRTTAAALLKRWDDDLAGVMVPRTPTEPKTPTAEGVTFRPIELKITGRLQLEKSFDGILAAGKNVDVMWAGGTLYVMKEKGKYNVVWHSPDQGTQITKVVYDGRFVWASAIRYRKWAVLVLLDPTSEKVWEVGPADGLPQGAGEQLKDAFFFPLELAPLEPGKICAAGSFGHAWVALITFDLVAKKLTVKVIHEANEAQEQRNKEQGGQTKVEFSPLYMVPLLGPAGRDGKPNRRIVLGRGGPANYVLVNEDVFNRPLVIDPDRLTVEVLGDRVRPVVRSSFVPYPAATTGEVAYLLSGNTTKTTGPALVRIGLPDVKAKTIIESLPAGTHDVVIHNNQMHFIREVKLPLKSGEIWTPDKDPREWWTAELDGKDLRLVGKGLPNIRVGTSSHYGLVCFFAPAGSTRRVLHAVAFPGPAPMK
jgi:hypothetical protein